MGHPPAALSQRPQERHAEGERLSPSIRARLSSSGLFGAKYLATWLDLRFELWRIRRDPNRSSYRDTALTPPSAEQFEELDLYKSTRGADVEVAKARARIHDHAAA